MTKAQRAEVIKAAEAFAATNPPKDGSTFIVSCGLTSFEGERVWEVDARDTSRFFNPCILIARYRAEQRTTAHAARNLAEKTIFNYYSAILAKVSGKA